MFANSARGKFLGESRSSSQPMYHSHTRKAEEMGGTFCCSLPLLFLGIYGVLATLVIAVLSFFLHQSSGSLQHTSLSGDAGVKCVEAAPQYSTTNLDFMNIDVSSKKIMDTAQNIKCDCDWSTILEWGIFEVASMVLLICIFCWLCLGDGLSQFRLFLKKRNTNTQRLEREYELAVKKQENLALKMGRAAACPETATAHASAEKESEKKPPFSAV